MVHAMSGSGRAVLVIFSDMRESTPDLDLEPLPTVPLTESLVKAKGELLDLDGVEVFVLGADGAGKSTFYWQSLQAFWREYLSRAGAAVREYSVLRNMPEGALESSAK
jgi:hypothetical protein